MSKQALDKHTNTTISYKPQITSVTDYYAIGSQINERTYDPVKPLYRFGFNTQEKTFELNRDHYTAKFWEYDSRLGRRWNVDPEPTTSWSNYSVLFDNPIKNIDILGNKPLDDYKLDKKGNISLIKKTDDKTDKLFATNEKGEIVQDKFIEVQKGILNKSVQWKGHDFHGYKIQSDEKAKEFFEFVAKNTDVEWSRIMLGKEKSNELNYIITSHEETKEPGALTMIKFQFRFNYNIRGHIHSHPKNTLEPSGLEPDKYGKGDIQFANWLEKITKPNQPIFRIYRPGFNDYIPYHSKSKKEDFKVYQSQPITLPEVIIK